MRAVIYCRVSTTEQAQNLSLPTQEKACREYCARQGYDVGQVFVDAGESAKTTDRPAFLQLLAYCREHKREVRAVVVYSLTRFSRNTADHHAIASGLRGLGISLRSVTEPIDDSPSGKLMEAILAGVAQFDNDARAERVVAGLHAAVDRGRWCWQAPIGYLNANPRRDGASLLPDPVRAPLVRQAFELYVAGVRGRDLRRRLHALGLRSKGAGAHLSMAGLYKLLRQRAYVGIIRPRGWTTDARGDFAPIVDQALFDQVQIALNATQTRPRAQKTHTDHPDFPLRRFVRCSCGRVLTGSWSTGRTKHRYAFYHCPNGCQRYAKGALETAFLALLDTLRPTPAAWRVIERFVFAAWRTAQRAAKASEAAARRQLVTLEQRRAKLDDAYIYQRAINAETYTAQRDRLDADMIVARMAASEAFITDIDLDGMLSFARTALERASTMWTAATNPQERLAMQWAFFPGGLRLAPGHSRFEPTRNVDRTVQREGVTRIRPRGSNAVACQQPSLLETFAAPISCLRFFELAPGAEQADQSPGELVGVSTPSWNRIASWLTSIYSLRRAA